jgi:SNF2 family DNA or RNA helicase
VISGRIGGAETVRREAEFRQSRGFRALVYQIEKGGVGKNFQEASVVVLMEPQFTPALEQQAIKRAHPMGQTLAAAQ